MRLRLLFASVALLLSVRAMGDIVDTPVLNGDVLSVSETDLPQYWLHGDISSIVFSAPHPASMGCIRLKFTIDSRGNIWKPSVDISYGGKVVQDWAMGVLKRVTYTPAKTNAAKRPVASTLTLSFFNKPVDETEWENCQTALLGSP